jgi:hypothetical protein
MNPLLERSRRKINEAAFFLDRISESRGNHPEFGYYLSAFLSAVRSVGFVLQADLRSQFRERFDPWWEETKAALPPLRVPFSVIVELRNQAQKAGELLPGLIVVARVDHPCVEEVTFTLDLRDGRAVIAKEEYRFKEGSAPRLELVNPDDSSEIAKKIVPALRGVFESLNSGEPNFEITSVMYQLDRDEPAVSFEELVEGFTEHVEAMRRVVTEANALFTPVGKSTR